MARSGTAAALRYGHCSTNASLMTSPSRLPFMMRLSPDVLKIGTVDPTLASALSSQKSLSVETLDHCSSGERYRLGTLSCWQSRCPAGSFTGTTTLILRD